MREPQDEDDSACNDGFAQSYALSTTLAVFSRSHTVGYGGAAFPRVNRLIHSNQSHTLDEVNDSRRKKHESVYLCCADI